MLAVTVTPGGSPALRELPSPIAPPGGILVRVRACGLCGSDVEKLRPGGAPAGSVLGHEIAGVVVDGALPAGHARRARPSRPLRRVLRFCLAGHEPLCAAYVASALEPGGFCELTAASPAHVAHAVLPLPDHVSDLAGSFVEPLGVRPARHRGAAAATRSWPARARSACSPRRPCGARGAHVRVLEPEPGRAAARRRARLRRHPRAGERFAGALLSAAAALRRRPAAAASRAAARALQRRRAAAARRRAGLPARARACAACARRRRATCARRSTLIASGAVECESLVDCVLGARGVRRGPRALHAAPGAQGGVRAVIAARFWAPRDVRIEEVPEPEPGAGRGGAPRRGGAHLRHRREVLPARAPGAARARAPAPFGHEYAGVVVARGEGAPFAEGDLVCGVNSAPCGACARLRGRARGAVQRPLPAAQRRLRASCCGCRRASRASTCTACPRACRPRSPPRSSRWPARCTAPTTRTPAPASASRSSAAGRSGGCSRWPARPAARSAELLGRGEGSPRSYETVIEAAGTPEAWAHAIGLAAPGAHGRAVRRPAARARSSPVDTYRLHYEALTLRGSFHHRPRDVRAALDLIERAAADRSRAC